MQVEQWALVPGDLLDLNTSSCQSRMDLRKEERRGPVARSEPDKMTCPHHQLDIDALSSFNNLRSGPERMIAFSSGG